MSIVNNFKIPSWAGKPPSGLHLDVAKEKRMVQKLMIDQKKCYFFGRNKQMCDFHIDHASCSRVHTALIWHKHLERPFLVDLNSTHGTFIGSVRIDGNKPQQVPMDSIIHFGASTRTYTIRERPMTLQINTNVMEAGETEDGEGMILGLPEDENELNNLTEFNTAHNRRIATVPDNTVTPRPVKRRRSNSIQSKHHVDFNEEEQIINPEDIDPSIGRFRNLVHSAVVPSKKLKLIPSSQKLIISHSLDEQADKKFASFPSALYSELDNEDEESAKPAVASMCGLRVPNPAPDIEIIAPRIQIKAKMVYDIELDDDHIVDTKKKKYAKEAWPGRKPLRA